MIASHSLCSPSFPIRFPSENADGDDGWRVDVRFGYDHPDLMEWCAIVSSKGRALLTLFLL